ncbi:fructosamine kinase family protein [Thalassobacillus hwangdonensis]|uniref:Fructosamine kinase family protein n=1 Tax=Thalassobacillus hwangdonensis TaxID=546108 RepID=A0ABW3L208_9BACI
MNALIQQRLRNLGDASSIVAIRPINGGDINQAYYVETEAQQYFVKANKDVPSHFFEVEATGLEAIRNTESLHVPEVYRYDHPANGETGMMVMEWIEGETTPDTAALLGERLAQMHAQSNEKFGYHKRTFIGTLDQHNQLMDNWIDYYRDQRILPQMKLAKEKGHMGATRQTKLEAVIQQFDRWLPPKPNASLLHGDLWGGNWMAGEDGTPYVIDPSVLYGDHGFELAFTDLFGGFPASFYDAYQATYPLDPEYEDRKELYQLFYLLVHLNIFGETYGSSVDRILDRYA